jgi:hypothetical protein
MTRKAINTTAMIGRSAVRTEGAATTGLDVLEIVIGAADL